MIKEIRKPSFQLSLGVLLFTATLLTGLGVTFLNYNDGQRTIRELSNQLFGEVSTKIFSLVKNHLDKAKQLGLLNERVARNFLSTNEDYRNFFYDTLKNFPEFTYVSVGNEKGALIGADYITKKLRVREWVQQGNRTSLMTEYGKDKKSGKLVPIRKSKGTYDPRVRPWYKKAKERGHAAWLDPFFWLPEKIPGITFAIPSFNKNGVIDQVFTVDIQLDFISNALRDFYQYKSGSLFIVNEEGELIAHNKLDLTINVMDDQASLPNIQGINDKQTQFVFKKWVASNRKSDLEYLFNDQRFLLKSKHLNVSQDISWHILMSVSEEEILARALESLYRSIGFSLLILVVIIIFSLLLSRHLTKSFNRVFGEMKDIFYFSLEQTPRIPSFIYEIDKISNYLSNIKSSLKSFKKYLSPILVKKYLLEGVEATLGGEEREVTVMFIDIENYTKISESLSTQDLIQLLNKFSMAVTKNIDQYHGTVDKFIGDSIMAFWGGIESFEDHAFLACQCALMCCEDIKNSDMNINIRVGVNTGKVIIGNFGSEERFNFTVLGDNVNQASRLESSNKVYKTNILISETTFLKLEDKIVTRRIDDVVLKGRKGATTIYEIADFREEKKREVKDCYEKALVEYQSQNWERSIDYLEKGLKVVGDDGPSLVLKERCQYYRENPPERDWDGVFSIQTK